MSSDLREMGVGAIKATGGILVAGAFEGVVFAANSYVFRIADPRTAAVYAVARTTLMGLTGAAFIGGGTVLGSKWTASRDPSMALPGAIMGLGLGVIVGLPLSLGVGCYGGMKTAARFASPMSLRTVIMFEGIRFAEWVFISRGG